MSDDPTSPVLELLAVTDPDVLVNEVTEGDISLVDEFIPTEYLQ